MGGAKGPPPDLPGFTFVESIGGGGFADVFLFTQHSTGRAVAVKVLRREHLSEVSLDQFRAEANIMAGVSSHPYIVTIHDASVAPDGRPYIVMEYYPEPHFGVRARGGRLGVAEVLKVGVQIASAVETAHAAKILHRDIKPANILTSTFGDPGLTDFGIAGVQSDEGLSVASGVSLGFAAPEVVLDEHSTGSRSSDVYSLAATVYALLTGRSPVFVPGGDNSPARLTERIATGHVVPFGRDDVPRSLHHLLHTALAAELAHRPASAVALAQALQDIEHELHLPPTPLVLAGKAGQIVRTQREDDDSTRRKPTVVSLDGPGAGSDPPGTTSPAPVAPALTPKEGAASAPTSARPARSTARRAPDAARDTVARPAETPGDGRRADHHDGEAGARTDDDPGTPNRLPLAVGAGVVVIALLAALWLVARPSDQGGAPSTTPTPMSRQDPIMGAAFIGPPTGLTVTLTTDGSVSASWDPPAGVDDASSVRYRISRAEDRFQEDGWLDEVVDTEAMLDDVEPNDDGTVCIEVRALLDAAISDPSDEACGGPS